MSDLKELSPQQLRELISQAKTRLKEVELPGKRWFIQVMCFREVRKVRSLVVEAQEADAAVAAVNASEDDLTSDPDAWCDVGDEVISFDAEIVEEETSSGPDYHIGEDGRLEAVG